MRILADTSAWVEYVRDTGSPTSERLEHHLRADELLTTDVVVMEMLAGARDDAHGARLAALLSLPSSVPVERTDWVDAARLQRRCRERGETVRRLPDCLIAAVAIRADVAVLHRDQDFDTLARHTALRAQSP
ncbi:MAG: PIN domain-containing protein [Actinomycetota bacterium]|nr:PIN domain-containing protein [Actinomycetota bacterium]